MHKGMLSGLSLRACAELRAPSGCRRLVWFEWSEQERRSSSRPVRLMSDRAAAGCYEKLGVHSKEELDALVQG